MQYDTVVSLGANCAVANAIRTYFGVNEAYPFDWWISHHDQALSVLRGNFAGLCVPDDLVVAADLSTVTSRQYGVWHHHDFPRDAEDKILPLTEGAIENARSKYRFLVGRMRRRLGGGRHLFVRYCPDAEHDSLTMIEERAAALKAELDRLFPNAEIHLLSLNEMALGLAERHGLLFDALLPALTEGMWKWPEYKSLFERREISIGRN